MIIASLRSENAKLKEKNEKLKKTNSKVMLCLAEYQVKMWQYEEKLDLVRSKSLPTVADVEELTETELDENLSDGENMDDVMSKSFTAEETRDLNSIEIMKRGDRTFIGRILQILYRENPSAIQTRTLFKNSAKNQVISPLKMKIITAMMIKRVDNVCDLTEKAERVDQIYINNVTSKSLYYLKQTLNKSK